MQKMNNAHIECEVRDIANYFNDDLANVIQRIWTIYDKQSAPDMVLILSAAKNTLIVESDSPSLMYGQELEADLWLRVYEQIKFHPKLDVFQKTVIELLLILLLSEKVKEEVRFCLNSFHDLVDNPTDIDIDVPTLNQAIKAIESKIRLLECV